LEGDEWRTTMWGLSFQLEKALELNLAVNTKLDVCNQELDNNRLDMISLRRKIRKYLDLVRFLQDENLEVKVELLYQRWLDTAKKNTSSSLNALPVPPPLSQNKQVMSSATPTTGATVTNTSYQSDSSSLYHWMAHSVWAIVLAWNWYCSRVRNNRAVMQLKDMQSSLAKLENKLWDLTLANHNMKTMALNIFRSKLSVAGLIISFVQQVWSAIQSKLSDANKKIATLISKSEAERESHRVQLMDTENYYEWIISELLKILEVKNNAIKGYKYYTNLYRQKSLACLYHFSRASAFLCQKSRDDLLEIENLTTINKSQKKEIKTLEQEMETVSFKREKELRELLLLRQQKVFQYEFLQLNSDSAKWRELEVENPLSLRSQWPL